MGHEIGLHFDEMAYPEKAGHPDVIKECIAKEADLLDKIIGHPIKTVSYHRPTQAILDAQLEIPGLINSYGDKFFHDYKYLSDSRRRWREPVLDIIRSKKYRQLHILTHAFWYNDEKKTLAESVGEFVNSGNAARWKTMHDNISDLDSIMPREEVR